jgi:beta-RFAP synthase
MTHSFDTTNQLPSDDTWLQSLSIESPARLHFGLMEVCSGQDRLFGGLGAMIAFPSTRLSLEVFPSDEYPSAWSYSIEAEEPWRSRIESVVRRWKHSRAEARMPGFSIRLENQPRMHAGLGSGTQVACATLSLLNNWYGSRSVAGKANVSVDEMSQITQRGKRSFVGLAGHQSGGLIVDHGLSIEGGARQVDRHEVPDAWYVVLAKPIATATISGVVENDYFGQSQAPNPHRESMWNRIQSEIVPAIQQGDLNRFGSALYEYGRDAGRVFARVQGGIYRDQVVASLIDWIRAQGVNATGQTSWGPTVYAIVANQSSAEELVQRLSHRFSTGVDAMVTPFNHTGYRVDRRVGPTGK